MIDKKWGFKSNFHHILAFSRPCKIIKFLYTCIFILSRKMYTACQMFGVTWYVDGFFPLQLWLFQRQKEYNSDNKCIIYIYNNVIPKRRRRNKVCTLLHAKGEYCSNYFPPNTFLICINDPSSFSKHNGAFGCRYGGPSAVYWDWIVVYCDLCCQYFVHLIFIDLISILIILY